MPCCCKDNVEASFVLGIVLAVLSVLSCFGDKGNGIYGVLISGILIFGAKQRNPTAIFIWMVFAIIGVVWLVVVAVIAIISLLAVSSHITFVIIFVIFVGALILFEIWTIIVAKRAREEIQGEGTKGDRGRRILKVGRPNIDTRVWALIPPKSGVTRLYILPYFHQKVEPLAHTQSI